MSRNRSTSSPRRLDVDALDALFTVAAPAIDAVNAGETPAPPKMPRFASVRLDAITHPNLIPRDRDVLAYLDSRGVGDRWVPVKIADVARFLGCDWRTVQRSLKRIRAAGLMLRHAVYVATPEGMRRVCDRLKLIGRRHQKRPPTSPPARPTSQPVPSTPSPRVAMTPVTGEPRRGKNTRAAHRFRLPDEVAARLDERLKRQAAGDSPD